MMRRAADNPAKKPSWRSERGTAAIEFGLLLPLLVALLLSGAEIGFFIQQTMAVNSAVAAGIAFADQNGFNAKQITSAILNDSLTPGLAVEPAPRQFCGCVAGNSVTESPCDKLCASKVVPGHYFRVGAQLKPQTIMPGGTLPLPDLIAVQATTRLN